MAFLSDITGGDVDLQAYPADGLLLPTGVTSAHALSSCTALVLTARACSPTSSTILGDYAATASMDTFVETRGDRHRPIWRTAWRAS